jgi:ferredoxin-NADP reductase
VEALNETVLRIRLQTDKPFDYFAGQFITLFRDDGLARSYSLASLPADEHLELHIRRIPGGAMSQWLHGVATGTRVDLQGPAGNCFYAPGDRERPILLAGAGTGLAPLYGIVRDALAQGHTGPVWLFHGALTEAGLYLTDELAAMERAWPNFRYVQSVLSRGESLEQTILSRFAKLHAFTGYVCGDAALVHSLRKKLFLAGMASKQIYSDAFLPSTR